MKNLLQAHGIKVVNNQIAKADVEKALQVISANQAKAKANTDKNFKIVDNEPSDFVNGVKEMIGALKAYEDGDDPLNWPERSKESNSKLEESYFECFHLLNELYESFKKYENICMSISESRLQETTTAAINKNQLDELSKIFNDNDFDFDFIENHDKITHYGCEDQEYYDLGDRKTYRGKHIIEVDSVKVLIPSSMTFKSIKEEIEEFNKEKNNEIKLKKRNISKLSDKDKINAIAEDYSVFKLIKNPSEEVQLAAVGKSAFLIQYINDPSEAVQLAAIKRDALPGFMNIKNPSEKAKLLALNLVEDYNVGTLIKNIKEPSEKMKLIAVKKRGNVIEFIKNPSEEVQLAAVKEDSDSIKYIKDPSEAVQLASVKKDGGNISYIKNPSEEVQLAAIKEDCWSIRYIKNPSEEVQLAAVKKDGLVIKYIKNPTKKVKELAETTKSKED